MPTPDQLRAALVAREGFGDAAYVRTMLLARDTRQHTGRRLGVAVTVVASAIIAVAISVTVHRAPSTPPAASHPPTRAASVSTGFRITTRIPEGKVTSYRASTGIGCVRALAPDPGRGCGYFLVPNGVTAKPGDIVEALVGTAPREQNNHWVPRPVVLINSFVVHG